MEAISHMWQDLPHVPPQGVLYDMQPQRSPFCRMQIPQMATLISDSTKMAQLDILLRELKAGGHRVLIYFQMTRMIDLMEEFLVYRNYRYLRLDGSSKISDRRDMVTDWQTRPEIFIFLLSTRAGGLGINLTAADTVIFYDHDWNPSNDSQAMDRAHRLGQTRQVTVYRLICRGTIDERIIKLARVKKDVQDMVVGGDASKASRPSEKEIMALLADGEDEDPGLAAAPPTDFSKSGRFVSTHGDVMDFDADEAETFFSTNANRATEQDSDDEEAMHDPADDDDDPEQTSRKKKRKSIAADATSKSLKRKKTNQSKHI